MQNDWISRSPPTIPLLYSKGPTSQRNVIDKMEMEKAFSSTNQSTLNFKSSLSFLGMCTRRSSIQVDVESSDQRIWLVDLLINAT